MYLNEFSLNGFVNTSTNELDLDIQTRTNGYDYVLSDYNISRDFKV